MKKKIAVMILAGALCVSTMAGCAGISNTDVVATVDGENITADVANFYARYQQAQYESFMIQYMGDNMWEQEGEEAGKTYQETVKERLMDELQTMYILEDHMEDYDVEITEDEQKRIQETATAFIEANDEESLEKVSGSQETVERVLTLMTIELKMMDAVKDGVTVEITDDDAAQKKMEYVCFPYTTTDEAGNTVDLTEEEKEALKGDAEAFAKEVTDGATFKECAESYGQSSYEVTFDIENQAYEAVLLEAADQLKKGEVTEVIEGETGYYVAQLVSEFDKDATAQKKSEMISQTQTDAYNELVTEWKEAVKITVNNKVWKKIDFVKLGVSAKVEIPAVTDVTETTEE